ncbi:MAG: hypothetical protein IJR62_06240 [Lachnospiraceae bacterium]|nr:hypothetical protein [Lachnospiraceae bacterium]
MKKRMMIVLAIGCMAVLAGCTAVPKDEPAAAETAVQAEAEAAAADKPAEAETTAEEAPAAEEETTIEEVPAAEEETTVEEAPETEEETKQMVGMVNPWSDHETLEDAEAATGFLFTLPAVIDGYQAEQFRSMGDTIIEVIYADAEGEEAFRLRKGKGQDDISGDYNTYDNTYDINSKGIDINMQGNEDGIHRIVFCSDTYSYSFTSGTCVPDESQVESLVSVIMEGNEDF